MSAPTGNPYWKVGKKGRGLVRPPDFVVIEERGDLPAGNRPLPLWPDREWIGPANQGGGRVAAEDNWTVSAKERQDTEMGDSRRRWMK